MISPSISGGNIRGGSISGGNISTVDVAGGRKERKKHCDNNAGWRMSRAKKGSKHYRECVRMRGSHRSYGSKRHSSPRAYNRRRHHIHRIHSSLFRGGDKE
jgi:hypothetical protein